MRNLRIKSQLMLIALTLLSCGAFAQTPQLFTPSGAVNGSTSSAGVGIGTSSPDAALGIKPGATLSFPALAIEATDAANTYSLYVEGLAGGDKHVQIATGDANSRLSLKCASATDKAPRLQMTSPNDVSANKAWAIFDYGSREVFLPDAKFKMRWMPGNASDPAIDMITSDGTTGVYLAPTVGNVGIGTATPSEALEVAGNIKVSGVGNGIEFPDGSVQTTAGGGGGASALNDLTDVNVAGASAGQFLQYSGSQWVATAAAAGADSDWVTSGVNNHVYNTTDSIGIGVSFPYAPLQLEGRFGISSDANGQAFNIHINNDGQMEFNANDVTSNTENVLTLDDDLRWVGVTNDLNVGGTTTTDTMRANNGFITNSGSLTSGNGLGVGSMTGSHIRMDTDDIQRYVNGSNYGILYLNFFGGDVNLGGSDLIVREDNEVQVNEEFEVGSADFFVNDATNQVGIGTRLPATAFHVNSIANNSSTGVGSVVFGDTALSFLTFDSNEMQSRTASGYSSLFLNFWGGDVNVAGGDIFIDRDVQVNIAEDLQVGLNDLFVDIDNNIVSTSGNVNVGGNLDVAGTTIQFGSFEALSDGGNNEIASNSDIRPTADNFYDLGTSSFRWDDVYATNGVIQTSDRRTKSNIEDLHYGLEEIMQLRPVSFEWKGKEGMAERKLGLIAQEVQPILDEVVKEKDLKMNEDGEIVEVELERLGMYYADIIPVLINGIQEQQAVIEEQNGINTAQQDLIEAQNEKIEMLENTLKDFGMIDGAMNSDLGNASSTSDEQTRLFQNRPNPFDNTTTIPYFLANDSKGQIVVRDVRSGSIVASYDINGQGHGEVLISAGTLAAGAYTYSLVINQEQLATKVMVLTR